MTRNNRLTQALFDQKKKTEQRNPLIAGSLGITMGGQTIVEVPDRASYVYVQVRSSTAEVIQAFNQTVSPVYGLPVLIQWQGNRYVVVERDTMRYSNWGDFSAYLPRHASTHEWVGSAGDVVFVSQQQFLPLMPSPSGSVGNTSIIINDYNLMSTGGTFSYSPVQATQNLTVWNPTTPTGAVMVLVSLDASNGQLRYDVNSGTVFGSWLTGSADVLPRVPAVPDLSRYLPIVAVRLISSTNAITWDNLYDVRPLFGVTRGIAQAGGGAAGLGLSSGVAPIWLNNGVFVATGTQINLLGGGFTISHSGTEIQLNIAGGGGGGSSGSLLLDTSNGPLFGPLVVYQKNPNTFNQYFDYSSVVGYLSGTSQGHFGAGIEAVNFSTGSSAYGVYVDDEGSSQGLFVGSLGKMDNPMVYFSHNIPSARNGGRYSSAIFQLVRFGGGSPNAVQYRGPAFKINEQAPNATVGAPSFEIDTTSNAKTYLWPTSSGTALHPTAGDYFPSQAPYFFDTFLAIPTGSPLMIVLNQGSAKFWIDPSGMVVTRGGYDTLYGTYNINGVPHTHPEITGGGGGGGQTFINNPLGLYFEQEGIPLGTGTTLNVRGPVASLTLSGTVADLFITGTTALGLAGGDLTGTYPNPHVLWSSGVPYYDTVYAQRIHAVQHQSGGFDQIPIDTLGAPIFANNWLDANTGSHGLMRQLSGDPTKYIGGDGLEHDIPSEREEFYLEDATLYVTGTHSLITTYPSGTEASTTQAIVSVTGTQFAMPFMSNAGLLDFIGSQEVRLIVTANIIAGTKITYLYAQLLKYSSSGTEVLMGSSNLHQITASKLEFDLGMGIPDTVFDPTERLEVKFFGIAVGAGGTPTAAIYYDGTTSSRLEVGVELIGGGRTTINIFNGLFGENKGVPLGTGTILNVNGSRLSMSISGTTLDLTNSPDPAELIGLYGVAAGVPLGTGTSLNVRGAALTISGTTLDLFITGAAPVFPQPVFGIMGQDEGISLGTGTTMNFVGPGVTATISGTVINVNVPGGSAGTPQFGVFGQITGTNLGTGSTMNFHGVGVTASISGTVLDVSISGSGPLWNVVSATGGISMVVNQNYLVNNQRFQVALRLPSGSAVGDEIQVQGMSSGSWRILQQMTGSVVFFASQHTSYGTGSMNSVTPYDGVWLLCVQPNNAWVVKNSMGNINLV